MALSKDLIEKQRQQLLEEKKRLEGEIDKLREFPDYGWDPESNIDETSDYETRMFIENPLTKMLDQINHALKAIEDGTYGQCSKCKKAIEEGRLQSIPYADICVTCNVEEETS